MVSIALTDESFQVFHVFFFQSKQLLGQLLRFLDGALILAKDVYKRQLPTCGTSRFSSPLGVYDFVKRSSVLCYNKERLREVKDDILAFAQAEGLQAHGRAVAVRFEEE